MNFSGEDTKLQIGVETTWGTGVAPTVELDMINEEFGETMIMATEPTLVGKATEGRNDIMGKKVPGGFQIVVKPDNIGLLLAMALGAESAAAAANAGSTVYDHDFSLITGSASTLPHFTAVVNKKAATFGYVSNKISQMGFECGNNDYLKCKCTTIGRAEQADALESLTPSVLRAFNFNDLSIEVDDTVINEVLSVTITLNNNLEDDLFVADGSEYMVEIDRQRREVTVSMEVLWNTDINTLRTNHYKAGDPVKLELIFTGDEAVTGYYYTLSFTLNNAYFMDDPMAKIGGPERLKGTLSFKAAALSTTEPFVVSLRAKQGTKYIS